MLGAESICTTAWNQVDSLTAAEMEVVVFSGVRQVPLPGHVEVQPTLARGKCGISYKLFGRMGALALHDYIVSRQLEKLVEQIDISHTWPQWAMDITLCGHY